jgi:type III pantothenate kinase
MCTLLVIDQGNSAAKLSFFNGEDMVAMRVIDNLTIESLLPLIEEFQPHGAIYCSVARLDAKFIETLRHLLDQEMVTFTAATPIPIKTDYDTPESLGSDRLAAAVGAATLFPGENVLIIDAGSAVTYDIVDAEGTFRGGNISPGLTMRFKALHTFTGRLPLIDDANDNIPTWGKSTHDAIAAGVVNGICAEIEKTAATAIMQGCSKIVFTGGDSEYLMSRSSLSHLPTAYEPDLVAKGLNRIYRYNETY